MSTSVNETTETWTVDDWPAETSVDDLPQQDLHGAATLTGATVYSEPFDDVDDTPAEHQAVGLSGRSLVVASATGAAGIVVLDLWLTSGGLTFFFDLCFVVLCLVAAMSVRASDLFTAGVLPPLLFAGVIAVVSLVSPGAFESGTGVDHVFLTGLATHAAGLVAAYAVTLATIAARTLATRA